MGGAAPGNGPPRRPYSYLADPSVPEFPDDRPVIVFDGYCALCSGWAGFVLRRDRVRRYRFLRAQSALGRALYVHYGLDPRDFETNLLIEDGIAWFRSEASIRMAEGLGAPWSYLGLLRLVPLALRDRGYDWIARHRLRLFGKRAVCYAPDAADRDRFIA